jgi:perosamine synthetase
VVNHLPVHRPDLGPDELDALVACIGAGEASGNTPTVDRFERAFASEVDRQHAIATSSGSTALHLAFAALRLGPGDEVIVPSFTFAPCADMVALTGARPVFADADPRTFNVTPASLEAALTPATTAVLVVHLFGLPGEIDAIAAIARERQLHLVEDCSQALGATVNGAPIGQSGVLSCYSFYGNKIITTGEGGMVTTNDEALADRLRFLRSHGQVPDPERPYLHTELGFNYRMSAFAAAVGLAQLARLDGFLARRNTVADRYRHRLTDCPGLELPALAVNDATDANWAFGVTVDAGDNDPRTESARLAAALHAEGVETRGFYHPLHLHPVYATTPPTRLAHCEHFAPRGLILPSGNALDLDDVDRVCDVIQCEQQARHSTRRPHLTHPVSSTNRQKGLAE